MKNPQYFVRSLVCSIIGKFSLLLLLILFIPSKSFSQFDKANLFQDNGEQGGSYSNPGTINFEETALLKAKGPCKVKKAYVFLAGAQAKVDTIRFVGDPSDGGLPGTYWVSGILPTNLIAAYIVNFTTSGWYEFDLSGFNIYLGGLDRIGVSHIIKQNGPYFVIDKNGLNTVEGGASFLCDVFKPNPDFYNIPGTIFSYAQGDFLVRFDVEYLFPQGTGSKPKPTPSMVDVTKSVGIKNTDGTSIKSAMASAVDIDKDGWDDLVIGSKFFRNNEGTFEDISSAVNLSGFYATMWGDIDNDGKNDFFALGGGATSKIYYGNEKNPFEFTENTPAILKEDRPIVTPLLFDMNRDGLLDIYLANGRTEANGQEVYFQDIVLLNKGNREFENITQSSGLAAIEPAPHYDTWGASVTDYNNDGFADIFVATYRLAPDMLLKNNGDGTFTNVGAITGTQGTPTAVEGYFGHGMGSDWGDFDNNGYMDLAVGNLGHPDQRGAYSNPSLIYKNDAGTFTEVGKSMQFKFFEFNSGVNWLDFDNDGNLDLASCQYAYWGRNTQGRENKFTRLYRNTGTDNNYKLQDVTWETGIDVHGAWTPVRLDYNNDGKMDLLICSDMDEVKLYKNSVVTEEGKDNWIEVIIENEQPASGGKYSYVPIYNVVVELETKEGIKFKRQLAGSVSNGRSSQSTNRLHFGLGGLTPTRVIAYHVDIPNYFPRDASKTNQIIRININPSLSVEDTKANSLEISPNPVKDVIKIGIKDEIQFTNDLKIEVVDITGNKVLEINDYNLIEKDIIEINAKDLLKGTYILKIISNETEYNQKFIKE